MPKGATDSIDRYARQPKPDSRYLQGCGGKRVGKIEFVSSIKIAPDPEIPLPVQVILPPTATKPFIPLS